MSTWPCPVQYYFHPKLHSYHFLLLLIYYFIARIFTFWGKSLYEAAVKDESLGLETKGTETLGLLSAGWYFPREPTNFVHRKFSKSQEILKNMH